MSNVFNQDLWDSSAAYLVIDDVKFDCPWFAQNRKPLWGCQGEFSIVGKGRKPWNVRWGKPLIFCCNEANFYRNMLDHYGRQLLPDSEQKWYDDNSVVVHLTEPLFAIEHAL